MDSRWIRSAALMFAGGSVLWGQKVPLAPAQGGRVVRTIDDPQNGVRWQVVKDAAHPGGPGRLVRIARNAGEENCWRAAVPVIRAGDRVRVEEHTEVVDAALDAVALDSAAAGESFPARLKVGGRVVRVSAVAAGRAELRVGTESGK